MDVTDHILDALRHCEDNDLDFNDHLAHAREVLANRKIEGRKPLNREEFLQYVGDFSETEREARALMDEAQERWQAIHSKFYRKDGKPRAKPPSQTDIDEKKNIEGLRGKAMDLRRFHDRQKREHRDPHSHTRPQPIDRWMPDKETLEKNRTSKC